MVAFAKSSSFCNLLLSFGNHTLLVFNPVFCSARVFRCWYSGALYLV